MRDIGRGAKAAARVLALAPAAQKDRALAAMAQAIRAGRAEILAANAEDRRRGKAAGSTAAFLDRLDARRQARRGDGRRASTMVRELADPVGAVTESWTRPNGMTIERVRVPLGVIGMIYESRPNVTADAGALCLKAGNAVILRGGSDSYPLVARDPCGAGRRPARGRPAGGRDPAGADARPRRGRHDAAGLDGAIDVIVPRGGKGLVARVQAEARVPVFAHLEGVCHVYVDKARRSRHGEGDRAQRQDAPHRRLRRGRDAAGRSRRAPRRISSRWSRCCSTPAARCAATPTCRRPTRA